MPLNPSENALFFNAIILLHVKSSMMIPIQKTKKCETALNPHMSTSRALFVLVDEWIVVFITIDLLLWRIDIAIIEM